MSIFDKKRVVFFDGAMGTMLQSRGLKSGELPELWNITNPAEILKVHREYAAAGCDILKTNTFGANALKLSACGASVKDIISAGVALAKEAAEGTPCLVALDIGPTGSLLEPPGDLGFEAAYSLFSEMVSAGQSAGADLILIETMSDTYEMKAAVLAAKENSSLPVIATMVFDDRGKLLTGGDAETAAVLLEGLGVDALGINCGLGPKHFKELTEILYSKTHLPIAVNPNAGLPQSVGGQTVFRVSPEEFAADMAELVRTGARIVGGCCGTTPEHIRQTVAACSKLLPLEPQKNESTVISSYSKTVVIGKTPVVIGERINPTGKARFKQALRENDITYIQNEGLAQQSAGAHILDVNVGLPEIDEARMMSLAVTGLQSVLELPLQIDTSSPAALEAALRVYNGKALINSVNGKEESIAAVFPLVKKYGGAAVALTLDENGIPETARGRLEIAKKILKAADDYGIPKKDIIFDPLTMTIGTDPRAALITLEALSLIKNELYVNTVLGVSNVSFGLPQRETLNSAFLTLALQRELDAAIINPLSPAMSGAYHAFLALSGNDEGCATYIKNCVPAENAEKKPESQLSLFDAVVQGLKSRAAEAAAELVKTRPALEVIDSFLIPALDKVGKAYEEGLFFLPRLLMSAEAAGAAFEALKAALSKAGAAPKKKGKIALATVRGDIHDIGKNIVKALLLSYGYEIIDLGRDVPPSAVLAAVSENSVRLVGLSALMTTTVPSMEETIRLLRAGAPGCKIMVGGAVLNTEYAEMIGADYYGKDAMAAVRYAEKVFANE